MALIICFFGSFSFCPRGGVELYLADLGGAQCLSFGHRRKRCRPCNVQFGFVNVRHSTQWCRLKLVNL